MMNKTPDEKELLLDHSYDGIQEFDYPLPRWWLHLFYLTIAFAFIYAGYYMTVGPTLNDELKVTMSEIEARKPKLPETSGELESSMLALLKNPDSSLRGKSIYSGKCAACHGQSGEGSIGPNLTDDFWIHGGTANDLVKTIRNGIGEKGMPPWGAILKDDEIYSLVAYIRSVRNSQPANAKQPQGEKFDYQEL